MVQPKITTCTLGLATVVITLGNLASFPSYSCLVYMIPGADPGLTVGGGLSIPRALASAKFYVLRPLLTSFFKVVA